MSTPSTPSTSSTSSTSSRSPSLNLCFSLGPMALILVGLWGIYNNANIPSLAKLANWELLAWHGPWPLGDHHQRHDLEPLGAHDGGPDRNVSLGKERFT